MPRAWVGRHITVPGGIRSREPRGTRLCAYHAPGSSASVVFSASDLGARERALHVTAR